MRGQDILIALGLACDRELGRKSVAEISRKLGVSPGEVHQSLTRLVEVGLLTVDTTARPHVRSLHRGHLLEFLEHGLRFVFPLRTEGVARGVSTGTFAQEKTPFVWAHAAGDTVGVVVAPLYPSVPQVAHNDEQLRELLALVDVLRSSDAEARKRAVSQLKERLQSPLSLGRKRPSKSMAAAERKERGRLEALGSMGRMHLALNLGRRGTR